MAKDKKSSVYLESSFISYISNKLSSDLVVAAHQKVSRDWWVGRRHDFSLFVSVAVLEEVSAGNEEEAEKRLELLEDVSVLTPSSEAFELAAAFLKKGALPKKAAEDALHVAMATVGKMDYLLSWNCKHIANGEVIKVVEQIAKTYGYQIPGISTPLALMGKYSYET